MKTHFLSLPPIWRHLQMFFPGNARPSHIESWGLVCHWQGRAGVSGSVEPPLRSSMLLEQTVSQGSRAHKHPPQCEPAISPKSQDVSAPWRSWWGETWGCRQVPRARPAEAQLQTPRLCWLPQYHEGWQPFDIFASFDESFKELQSESLPVESAIEEIKNIFKVHNICDCGAVTFWVLNLRGNF